MNLKSRTLRLKNARLINPLLNQSEIHYKTITLCFIMSEPIAGGGGRAVLSTIENIKFVFDYLAKKSPFNISFIFCCIFLRSRILLNIYYKNVPQGQLVLSLLKPNFRFLRN